ncbi:MAG: hypothetical protein AABZ53_04305 [Planctomycetota bacterium]
MSRLRASRLAVAAIVAMVLGTLAAGYIAVMDRESAESVVDDMVAKHAASALAKSSPKPGAEGAKGAKDTTPPVVIDTAGAGTRLGLVKNHPVPLPIEPPKIDETETVITTTSTEPIKYVGPVRLGVTMLALVSFNEKQRVLAEGKTFGVTVDSATKTTKLVSVSADAIIVETDGEQRQIAKADSDGEVVSFLGNKPTRNKPVVMKPTTDPKAKGRTNFAGESIESIVSAKQAKIMAQFNRTYQEAKKARGVESDADLREKIIEKMQADGIDRATAERSLEK